MRVCKILSVHITTTAHVGKIYIIMYTNPHDSYTFVYLVRYLIYY